MRLPPFDLHRPETPEAAAALLARLGDSADVVAGGTDLLPNYKNRLNNKPHVVSLNRVRGMRELSATRLGALTRLVEVERSEALAAQLPVLVETARAISSPPLREHGTVGGNLMLDTRCHWFNQAPMWRASRDFCLKAEGTQCLVVPSSNGHCYATYSGELAASLLVLGASLELRCGDDLRTVPLDGYFLDEGITRFTERREGDLLCAVTLPADATTWQAGYRKLRIRDSIDFPSLGVAVGVRMNGAEITDLRIAHTALASRPALLDDVCGGFVGRHASPDVAAEIGAAASKACTAYRNVPLDPKYRRKMVAVFVRRLLAQVEPAFG